ncbi:MAG TPA: DUF805 domain-containing protein [Methylocystis sp.]|nr:DUF805 domain-containing protein [Methylocystis sp.]
MSKSNNTLSFGGRIDQRTYWIYVSTIMALKIIATIMVVTKPKWDIFRHTDFLLLILALIVGKRLRDFGYSALWGWGALAMTSLVIPLYGAIAFGNGQKDFLQAIPPFVGLLNSAILIVFLVVVGVKKGDPETNRFGAPENDSRSKIQI